MKRMMTITVGVALLLSSALHAAIPATALKKRMLSDLDFIKSTFEVKYAPLEWKRKYAAWNLEEEVDVARAKIHSLSKPTVKDFQVILKEFFNSACDYHVTVAFHSTEMAYLPFLIKGAEGRYFVSSVERLGFQSGCYLEVGDEVLRFGGHPIDQVVQEIRQTECGCNTPETDQALAELTLTNRSGELGHIVPQGGVDVVVKRKKSGKTEKCRLKWNYYPEKIRDFAHLGSLKKTTLFAGRKEGSQRGEFQDILPSQLMMHQVWNKRCSPRFSGNGHILGARTSFIPALGRKLWESDEGCPFDAYIFTHPSGRRIGYIRIPDYNGADYDVDEFAEILYRFQLSTDALVVDQINNPGGSIFYLYGLASLLTQYPLSAPYHHITLTQQEVEMAVTLLPLLEEIHDDQAARWAFGETFGGYPISYEFIQKTRKFCECIIEEWNAGHLYTRETHLFGVDQIQPHPYVQYTKPIVVLVNSLDFSAGDFFPAILQDNKRALIFGSRTAGAGGFLHATEFPNQMGIKGFHLTASLAERSNNNPLENLGVVPDIAYTFSVRDLQENFVDYVNAILKAVDKAIEVH